MAKMPADNNSRPKDRQNKQGASASLSMSYKELRRSTYLGALDLLNIQGQYQERQNHKLGDSGRTDLHLKKPSSLVVHQANLIFKEIFEPYFANCSETKNATNNYMITHSKYEQAITAYFTSADDLVELRALYSQSDAQGIGYITKEDLIHAIQQDLQKSNEDFVAASHNPPSNRERNEPGLKEEDVLQASPDTLTRRLMDEGKEISNPKHDPILLWLLNHDAQKTLTDDQRACHNLAQVIEYVNNYKLEQYHNQLSSLQYLFQILLRQSQRACKQYESAQQQVVQLRQRNPTERQAGRFDSFRDYAMKDLNAEVVRNLECEVDRLKAFEMMYHAQQRKLEQSVAENHELEIQRDNLQSINQDLLHDFEAVQKERDNLLA